MPVRTGQPSPDRAPLKLVRGRTGAAFGRIRASCSTSTARCSISRRRRARYGCRRAWRRPSTGCMTRTSGALALVSGRSLNDIDLIFAPAQFPAVGGHGAEMRLSTDSEAVAIHAPPMDKELKRRLAAIAKLSPGILLEDKGYSLALHYRLAPHAEKAIYEAVSLIRADLPNAPIEVLPGKCVCEIKHSGFNKASGVLELMTHEPFQGPPSDFHRRRRYRRERVRDHARYWRAGIFRRPARAGRGRSFRRTARRARLAGASRRWRSGGRTVKRNFETRCAKRVSVTQAVIF